VSVGIGRSPFTDNSTINPAGYSVKQKRNLNNTIQERLQPRRKLAAKLNSQSREKNNQCYCRSDFSSEPGRLFGQPKRNLTNVGGASAPKDAGHYLATNTDHPIIYFFLFP
jgi:hypothetical protein